MKIMCNRGNHCAGLLLLFGIFFLSTSAWAQMPGMESPKKAEPAADTVVTTPQSETASLAAHQADGSHGNRAGNGVDPTMGALHGS